MKVTYHEAKKQLGQITSFLQSKYPESNFLVSGDFLRKKELISEIIIISNLESYPDLSDFNPIKIQKDDFVDFNGVSTTVFQTTHFLPIIIKLTDTQNLDWFVWKESSDAKHIEVVLEKNNIKNLNAIKDKPHMVKDLYSNIKLPFIFPEHRDGKLEFNGSYNPQALIGHHHIQGSIHMHTTYSDGMHSIRDMALYCKNNLNQNYMAVSDHSYAMNERDIENQASEIQQLNNELFPFKIFHSVEVDILMNGKLQYPDELLKVFDFVIASVHFDYKMTKKQATKRITKAIENKYVRIIGHLYNRYLDSGNTYDLDLNYIMDAYKANNIISELNCTPNRMDLDYRHIQTLMDKGIMISINQDAHSCDGLDRIEYGVNSARKGYLTQNMCLNAMDVEKFKNIMIYNK
jgi:DNA polymerase (family 10)